MYMYVCLYMHACICMHVYVCMYMYVCICMYAYVCVYVCVYMYVCMYVCMYMCVYAYMYMYVCLIYWEGNCPGEMSYPKREGNCPGELSRGKLSRGELSYTRPKYLHVHINTTTQQIILPIHSSFTRAHINPPVFPSLYHQPTHQSIHSSAPTQSIRSSAYLFIHSGYFYRASSSPLLLRGSPEALQATVSEGRTCPRSLRGGNSRIRTCDLRTQGTELTTEPPRPTMNSFSHFDFYLYRRHTRLHGYAEPSEWTKQMLDEMEAYNEAKQLTNNSRYIPDGQQATTTTSCPTPVAATTIVSAAATPSRTMGRTLAFTTSLAHVRGCTCPREEDEDCHYPLNNDCHLVLSTGGACNATPLNQSRFLYEIPQFTN